MTFGLLPDYLIPTPAATAQAIWHDLIDPQFWFGQLFQTLYVVLVGLQFAPQMLRERGCIDGAVRRNLTLARQAETAPLIYGDRPVIAAGSTGSIPATARLLRAIAELPRGVVVLPGLDTGLTADDLKRLTDPAEELHAHPQYGLARLLVTLGALPEVVAELGTPERPMRTRIVRAALAEPEATANWPTERAALADDIAPAFAGVSIMAAPGEDFEARGIAVAGVSTPARDGSRFPSSARLKTLSPSITAVAAYPGSPGAAMWQT